MEIKNLAGQLVATQQFNATTGQPMGSEVLRADSYACVQRSYDLYTKRPKPLILLTSPTSQRQVGSWCLYGSVSYRTRAFKPNFGVSQFYKVNYDTLVDTQYGPLGLYALEKITGGVLSAFPSGTDKNYKTWANVERRQACETKLLKKLKRKYESPEAPDGNLTETFAEADKTFEWLYQRTKSIAHVLDGVHKRNWVQVREGVRGAYKQRTVLTFNPKTGRMQRGTPKVTAFDKRPLSLNQPDGWSTKDISDIYLEVHFALSPLLSDAASVCVDFAKLVEERLSKLIKVSATDVVGYKYDRVLKPKYWPVGSGAGTGQMPSFSARFRVRDVMKVTAVYEIVDDWAVRLQQAGVSLNGLGQAVYARSPWSWLLDWGVGISEYLEAVNADAGMRFVSGYDVRRIDVHDYEFTHVSNGDAYDVVLDRTPAWRLKSTERSVRTSSPRAYTMVKSPLGTSHAVTALALMRSLPFFNRKL